MSGAAAPSTTLKSPPTIFAYRDGDERNGRQRRAPGAVPPPRSVAAPDSGDGDEREHSWDYFDRLRKAHVDQHSSIRPPSDVYRVPSSDGKVDANNSDGGEGAEAYYDLRHLVGIIPLLVNAGNAPRQTTVEMAGAALLALRHVNGGIGDAVPELANVHERCGRTRFTMDFLDSRHRPIEASRALLQDVLKRGRNASSDGVEIVDGEGDRRRAQSAPIATAVIGSYRSAVSAPLATLGGVTGMPQFSPGSTSPALDNRDRFPLFGRTMPSADADAAAVVSFFATQIKGEDVTHFGILYLQDTFGIGYQQALRREARKAGMTVSTASIPIRGEMDSDPEVRRAAVRGPIEQLRRTGLRYFVGAFFYEDYEAVMLEAVRGGIAGRGNFWVFADGLIELGSAVFDASTEYGSELIEASRGSAVLAFAEPNVLEGEPHYDAFLRHWRDAFRGGDGTDGRGHFDAKMRVPFGNAAGDDAHVEETLREFRFSDHPSSLAILAYDTVVAATLAVCDAERAARASSSSRRIEEGSDSDVSRAYAPSTLPLVRGLAGADVFAAFVNNTFRGIYGTVSIDPTTGSGRLHTMQYSVSNLLPDAPDDSGRVKIRMHPSLVRASSENRGDGGAEAATPSYTWRTIQPFIYSDGTTKAPASVPPLEHDYDLIPSGVLAAGYFMCAVIVLTSIACFVWTYRRREHHVIKAAQPVFLWIVASGAFIMGSAIIPLGLQEPGVSRAGLNAACQITPWLCTVGFSLMFAALYAKEIRIAMVMLNKNMRRIKVTAAHVMKPALVLVGANAVIMAVWTAVAPLSYERRDVWGSVDSFGRPTKSRGMCVLPTDPNDPEGQQTWWVGTMLVVLVAAVNGCAVLSALRQVYLTRRIETEFSESKWITLSMISIFQAFLVGIPLILVGYSNGPTTRYVLVSVLIFIVCQSIMTLIFVPKVYFMREWEKKKERRRKERQRKMQTPNWAKRTFLGKRSSLGMHSFLGKFSPRGEEQAVVGQTCTLGGLCVASGAQGQQQSGKITDGKRTIIVSYGTGATEESDGLGSGVRNYPLDSVGASSKKMRPDDYGKTGSFPPNELPFRSVSELGMDNPGGSSLISNGCNLCREDTSLAPAAQRRVPFQSVVESSCCEEAQQQSRRMSNATEESFNAEIGELRVGFREQRILRSAPPSETFFTFISSRRVSKSMPPSWSAKRCLSRSLSAPTNTPQSSRKGNLEAPNARCRSSRIKASHGINN